jgi:hypothetical protein
MTQRENAPDLNWLVPRRSEISALALRLYRLTDNFTPRASNDPQSAVLQLLIGIAFALWRAVFLVAYVRRSRRALHKAAKEFLMLVIRDNAIAFPQDRGAAPWTGGYYLNDAIHRLIALEQRLEEADMDVPSRMAVLHRYLAKSYEDRIKTSPRKLWVVAHEVAVEACSSFAKARTARRPRLTPARARAHHPGKK